MRLCVAVRQLALAATLHAVPTAAQHPAPAATETLAGVPYGVPAGYVRVANLGDRATAVFHDSRTNTWVFVAILHQPEQRPRLIDTLVRRLGRRVLAANPDTLEWQAVPSYPMDEVEGFRLRLESVGGPRSMDISFRQFRPDGRDVLVGSVFVSSGAPDQCGETTSVPAAQAEAWVAASLLGRPAPEPVTISGVGETVLGASTPAPPAPAPAGDPEATRIQQVFASYMAALRDKQGAAAADLMTPAVLESHSDLRMLALHASPAEVRALPLAQRVAVLGLRLRYAGRLSAMTAHELFAAATTEGTQRYGDITLSAPVVRGNVADAVLVSGGRRTSSRVAFVRGPAGWRIDTLPTNASTGCLLRANMRRAGVSRYVENEIIPLMLQSTTGRTVSADIWQPLERVQPPR